MVAALSGLVFSIQLDRRAQEASGRMADRLETSHGARHASRGLMLAAAESGDEESDVNLTPMLDVVFIMLIFFIVTASFVKEAGIDISRPPAAKMEKPEKGNILVMIAANDQLWIDRRPVDPRALRANIERMHAENPQGSVVIVADEESSNGLLVRVMDAARLAGVDNVSLASEVVD
jgi:biopolymer transport protein ExbD